MMAQYKLLNGERVEMTAEEIAETEALNDAQAPSEPTPEERIAALEEQLAATKILLGVE